MKKRMTALLLLAVMSLSLVLAGCEPDSPAPSSGSSGSAPAASGTPDSGNTGSGSTTSEPKTLTIAMVNDVISMDPAAKDSGTEMGLNAHLYDPLVDYDVDLSLKPGLAESWSLLDDGLTWQFKLRKGVKFSNGNDFNADDVVFSFERILNDPALEMGVYLGRLDHLEKVDDYTVNLITKYHYPVFVNSLKHIMMLDKETCEGLTSEEISANPVGTGRYLLEEHVKESTIKLVRNDNYWGELPEAERVEFRVITNATTRTAALLNGEVDFINNVPVMDVDRLSANDNIQIVTNPSLSCNYMGFDLGHETGSVGTDDPNPLKNVKVRQAIYHAINIDEIISKIMNGYATPAISYMPDICVGFDPNAERLSYDPELAKQLLAEAGYSDGFYLRVDSRSDGEENNDQVAQAIASYLEKIGIRTEVNLMPRATFFEKVNPENLQSSFFMARWGDSSGEGMVILNDMVYTYNGKPNLGEGNKGLYSNPEVDALLDQASTEPDQAKRAELVKKVDAITREEAVYIPLFFKENVFGVRNGLTYTPRADDHIMAWDFKFE